MNKIQDFVYMQVIGIRGTRSAVTDIDIKRIAPASAPGLLTPSLNTADTNLLGFLVPVAALSDPVLFAATAKDVKIASITGDPDPAHDRDYRGNLASPVDITRNADGESLSYETTDWVFVSGITASAWNEVASRRGLPSGGANGQIPTIRDGAIIWETPAGTGLTPEQAAEIAANTAKVGITPQQSSAITSNTTAIAGKQDALTNAQIADINRIDAVSDKADANKTAIQNIRQVSDGGADGEVLTATGSGYGWEAPPTPGGLTPEQVQLLQTLENKTSDIEYAEIPVWSDYADARLHFRNIPDDSKIVPLSFAQARGLSYSSPDPLTINRGHYQVFLRVPTSANLTAADLRTLIKFEGDIIDTFTAWGHISNTPTYDYYVLGADLDTARLFEVTTSPGQTTHTQRRAITHHTTFSGLLGAPAIDYLSVELGVADIFVNKQSITELRSEVAKLTASISGGGSLTSADREKLDELELLTLNRETPQKVYANSGAPSDFGSLDAYSEKDTSGFTVPGGDDLYIVIDGRVAHNTAIRFSDGTSHPLDVIGDVEASVLIGGVSYFIYEIPTARVIGGEVSVFTTAPYNRLAILEDIDKLKASVAADEKTLSGVQNKVGALEQKTSIISLDTTDATTFGRTQLSRDRNIEIGALQGNAQNVVADVVLYGYGLGSLTSVHSLAGTDNEILRIGADGHLEYAHYTAGSSASSEQRTRTVRIAQASGVGGGPAGLDVRLERMLERPHPPQSLTH